MDGFAKGSGGIIERRVDEGERVGAEREAAVAGLERLQQEAMAVQQKLADMDVIEKSNLARSVLYRPEDEGQPKALTAARAARAVLGSLPGVQPRPSPYATAGPELVRLPATGQRCG